MQCNENYMIDALTAVDHLRVEHDKNINGLAFCIFKCIQLIKYFRTSVQPVGLSQFLNNFDNNNI